jgi:hypothetical protein
MLVHKLFAAVGLLEELLQRRAILTVELLVVEDLLDSIIVRNRVHELLCNYWLLIEAFKSANITFVRGLSVVNNWFLSSENIDQTNIIDPRNTCRKGILHETMKKVNHEAISHVGETLSVNCLVKDASRGVFGLYFSLVLSILNELVQSTSALLEVDEISLGLLFLRVDLEVSLHEEIVELGKLC